MTNKELVEKLNNLKIKQISSWGEDIPEDIWKEHFENKLMTVDSGLDVDKHRWYETSTEVIAINEGFIGIRSVTDCFSEQSSIEDMFFILQFFEMQEIKVTSYKKI